MSGKIVIEVENLSKLYRLGSIGGATLREDLGRWWARRRGRPDPYARVDSHPAADPGDADFWALREVSFQVHEGEVLGVIGRNGAGKSTLLKILSRITTPTTGRALIRGRVGSLLEVGTGFHPELTGRENIYLNGAILGMSSAEITRKLEEIVEFAEMSKFIDTPVKRYSSGMTVRLAFSVAAHLDTDILFVDEVLAVGDQAFQEKCLTKMDSVSRAGRTVLFVSHQQGMLAKLCSSGMVLRNGSLFHRGSISSALSAYHVSLRQSGAVHSGVKAGPLADQIEATLVEIAGRSLSDGMIVDPLSTAEIKVRLELQHDQVDCGARLDLRKSGVHLFSFRVPDSEMLPIARGLEIRSMVPEKLLSPGAYELDLWFFTKSMGRWCHIRSLANFEVAMQWAEDYQPDDGMGNLNLRTDTRVSCL